VPRRVEVAESDLHSDHTRELRKTNIAHPDRL
jgi:hypothetical protein